MKAAKPPAGDATTPASSRRSQPVRQTRTNPPRNSASLTRNATGRDSTNAGHQAGQPIEIFPGITHFTDAITALPKDLVRHFTLLKEVDAKICQPEDQLFQLVHDLLAAPLPNHRSTDATISSSSSSSSALIAAVPSAPVSVLPNVPRAQTGTPASAQNNNAGHSRRGGDPTFGADNVPRRIIARQAIQKMQDMLVSLEEKNHVISVANDTLQRQLNRVEETWPHLEREFGDEAKWGSTTHWAYPENRLNNRNAQQQSHNGRRDQTGHLTAAAQALAEEAAARSDARKQAVAAKKRNAPHQESDLDDHDKQKNDHGRKPHKSRKTAAESPANVGLGITAPGGTPNGNPPPKRRKVDKTANGTPGAGGAMASVFSKDAQKAKTASPRETPAPEPTSRKRKPLPTSSSNGGKKKNGVAVAALSPSVTSSPVLNNFPEPKAPVRASPAPTSIPKAAAARAKPGSVPANTEKLRPSPAALGKPNGAVPKSPFMGPAPPNTKAKENGGTNPPDEAPEAPEPKQELPKPDPEQPPAPTLAATRRVPPPPQPPPAEVPSAPKTVPAAAPAVTGTSTKVSHGKKEGSSKPESVSGVQSTVLTTVTTKSGRASKPSTPALSTFPEPAPAAAKTRPSRNSETASGKRSHKKGAAAQSVLAEEDATSSLQGEDEDTNMDEDEPTYCYCNGVSYGEMVACDAEGCEREWFHLECVGLKVAPKTNAKWYCEDCKEKMKNSGKKVNGR